MRHAIAERGQRIAYASHSLLEVGARPCQRSPGVGCLGGVKSLRRNLAEALACLADTQHGVVVIHLRDAARRALSEMWQQLAETLQRAVNCGQPRLPPALPAEKPRRASKRPERRLEILRCNCYIGRVDALRQSIRRRFVASSLLIELAQRLQLARGV